MRHPQMAGASRKKSNHGPSETISTMIAWTFAPTGEVVDLNSKIIEIVQVIFSTQFIAICTHLQIAMFSVASLLNSK